jgi:hypothetical protein
MWSKHSRTVWWFRGLSAVAITGCCFALFLHHCRARTDASAKLRLSALHLGLANYCDANGRLPGDGASQVSWRLVMRNYIAKPPYVIHLNAPWNSAANAAVREDDADIFGGLPECAGLSVAVQHGIATRLGASDVWGSTLDMLPNGLPLVADWYSHSLRHWSEPGDAILTCNERGRTAGMLLGCDVRLFVLLTDGVVAELSPETPCELLNWSNELDAGKLESIRTELKSYLRPL